VTEVRLINNTDIRGYGNLSPNFTGDRLTNLIDNVQRIALLDLFGEQMYYDFFENISETYYVNLRDGNTYTIGDDTVQYFGLKPYLCHLFLADYALIGDSAQGEAGNFKMMDQVETTKLDFYEKKELSKYHRGQANIYKAAIIRYINDQINDFTKYYGYVEKRSSEPRIQNYTL